ncbi:MAG TPA: TonB-dependent receptor [Bacteroidales bacterium]|nr:TonB-dependent receptor [Bacteroidales bacterium]
MKKTTIPLLIALLIFLNSSPISSQEFTQTLRGRVIDAYTELPLPGVVITIQYSDPLKGTATDSEGFFRFENLPVGRIDLSVSSIGYKPEILTNLLLTSGRELIIEVRLVEQVYSMEEIVIKPRSRKEQPLNEMAVVSARSFTIDETERYAGSLGDPSRMATNFAGVSSVSDQRNDIVIRGNSPLGLLWRLEGVEIPNPNHFGSLGSTGGPISMLNNNHLANSDFYTSAFPAEFGNAISGVFDLRMRNGNNQRREFMGQVGFNGFELGAEGPFSDHRKASYLISFRYSTLELLHALGMSFGTGEAIPKYKDLSLKLNFPLNNGRLSLFALGGDNRIAMLDSEGDDAQYGFSGTDLYYRNKMGVVGLSYVRYLTDNARLTGTVAVSGIEGTADIYDLAGGLQQKVIDENMHEIKYTISTKYNQRFNTRNYLNAGLVLDMFDLKYIGAQFRKTSGDYFYYMNSGGNTGYARLFSEWQHRFSDKLTLSTGLNTSYFFLNDSKSVEPRFGLKWSYAPGQSFNLGAGLHSQTQMKAVYFSQKMVSAFPVQYEKTNEHLDLSKSIHFVAGYDRLLGEEHRLKAELYYQKLYNIPVSKHLPEYSLINQGGGFSFVVLDSMENTGTGQNYGMEITIEKFLQKGFYYLVTFSLFDAEYKGYDGVRRNSAFNNRFVFNALSGHEWKLGNKSLLSADVKIVYAGGNPYLEIDAERTLAENSLRYHWDQAYEKHYPNYFRMNGRITFRLNMNRLNQEWALDLQNITNHKNIFTQNWNNSTQKISTSYQMGFMPMVTYRICF